MVVINIMFMGMHFHLDGIGGGGGGVIGAFIDMLCINMLNTYIVGVSMQLYS